MWEPPPHVFQTECPICSLILRDPYQCKSCGTNFCCTCSKRVQVQRKPCPTCREDSFELFSNKGLKRSLHQIDVLCTYSKDGCEWTGELGELEHHLTGAHCDEPFHHEGRWTGELGELEHHLTDAHCDEPFHHEGSYIKLSGSHFVTCYLDNTTAEIMSNILMCWLGSRLIITSVSNTVL